MYFSPCEICSGLINHYLIIVSEKETLSSFINSMQHMLGSIKDDTFDNVKFADIPVIKTIHIYIPRVINYNL